MHAIAVHPLEAKCVPLLHTTTPKHKGRDWIIPGTKQNHSGLLLATASPWAARMFERCHRRRCLAAQQDAKTKGAFYACKCRAKGRACRHRYTRAIPLARNTEETPRGALAHRKARHQAFGPLNIATLVLRGHFCVPSASTGDRPHLAHRLGGVGAGLDIFRARRVR